MLSKSEFVSVIETLKESDCFMTDIGDVCRKYGLSYCGGVEDMCCKMHSTIVDILENMFDDDEGFVSWWVYDCSYGVENATVVDFDGDESGEVYKVDTPEKLYDLLAGNEVCFDNVD